MGLSNVEKSWIGCRWSDLMQVATWGSTMSVYVCLSSVIDSEFGETGGEYKGRTPTKSALCKGQIMQ